MHAQTPPDAGALLKHIQNEAPARPLPEAARPRIAGEPQQLQLANSVSVTVKSFRFIGNRLVDRATLEALTAPWVGKTIGLDDLKAITAGVADFYRAHGWIVRAFLPPQDITDGVVTVQVVEARFGGASVDGRSLSRVTPDQISGIVEHQQAKGAPVNGDALDRALLLAGDLPGVSVNGNLVAGPGEGETSLAIQAVDAPLLQGDVIGDNAGSRGTGTARVSFTAMLESLVGGGDQERADIVHSQGSDYLRLGVGVPLGFDGLRAGVNATALNYRLVADEFAPLQANGQSRSFGADLSYPIWRAREANLRLLATADRKSFVNMATGAVYSASGHLAVGNYAVQGSDASIGGSDFSALNFVGNQSVTPRGVTPSAGSGVSKVYDGTTAMNGLTIDAVGALAGDVLAASGSGTFASRNAGAGVTYTVSNLALAGADASDYYLIAPSGSFTASNGTISRATLVVTGASVANKVYDGTTAAVVSGGSMAAIATDNVVLDSAGATGTFADKNVGMGIAVAASGYTLEGTDAGNYTLVQPTGLQASISPKPLTVSGSSAADKVFDANAVAVVTVGALNGLVGAETLSLNAQGTFASMQPSSSPIPVSVTFALGNGTNGGLASNYTMAGETLSALILPAPSDVAQVGVSTLTPAIPGQPGPLGTGTASDDGVIVRLIDAVDLMDATGAGAEVAAGARSGATSGAAVGPAAGAAQQVIDIALRGDAAQRGFRAPLPEAVDTDLKTLGVPALATLADDSPLPVWLHFDSISRAFYGSRVPQSALPLNAKLRAAGKQWVVVVHY